MAQAVYPLGPFPFSEVTLQTPARASDLRRSILIICLDRYMPSGVYKESGFCFRSHRRAEPPRHIEPPGLIAALGRRDRTSASYAAAGRVQAPASPAGCRFRGIHGGCTAPSLPAETGTAAGTRCLAGSVPPILVRPRRCPRTPPRPHGSTATNGKDEKEDKGRKMTDRDPCTPRAARGLDMVKWSAGVWSLRG